MKKKIKTVARMESLTTEQLGEKLLESVQKMSSEDKQKVRKALKTNDARKPRRAYGIGDFLDYISGPTGLVASARKARDEERLMLNLKVTPGMKVN